jgi:peptide/nickel transport system permease protein
MFRLIVSRLATGVPTLLVVSLCVFAVVRLIPGDPAWRIVLRHMMPNCLPPLLVQSTLLFGTAILSAAYLGFLGLGAQPPTPEWGTMLAKARDFLRTAPHLSIFPGLTILLTVPGLNLLGDGLRDVLDPQAAG